MSTSLVTIPVPQEFSIDELAAHTGVPTRTIRFYQSKGALHKPKLRGRKAVYEEHHVERLQLIATLQERGLRIRAIRDLVARIDSGELVLDEWLGLQQRIHSPEPEQGPQLLDHSAVLSQLQGQSGLLSELVSLKIVRTVGEKYLIERPELLAVVIKMERSGIAPKVAVALADLAKKRVAKLASELVKQCIKNAVDVNDAIDVLPGAMEEIVSMQFRAEIRRTLGALVDSGKLAKLGSTNR